MSSAHAYEAAVKELEKRRARVAAAAEAFLKGAIPLEDLRLESSAATVAEKACDEALRRWRDPTSYETQQRELARLNAE